MEGAGRFVIRWLTDQKQPNRGIQQKRFCHIRHQPEDLQSKIIYLVLHFK